MATSGTAVFNPDFGEIAEEAYERIGIELRTGYQFASARRSLNIMAQEWQNRGINLWTVESGTVAIVANTATYTLPADTIDIIEHQLRDGSGASQTDYTLTRISVSTYAQQTNKLVTGRPLQIYVDRKRDAPQVTLWPVPDSSYTLAYWRMRRIQDVGSGGANTIDVPSRFIPCLVAGLAYHLAVKNPSSADRVAFLKGEYEEQFRMAAEEDRERATTSFVPYSSW